MTLRVYNTLSREKEEFAPLHPPKVGFYSCGPTVYNYAHIGNLRTYIFNDLLKKTLRANNFDVTHVMNITDVGHLTDDADEGEDKMEKGARREGKSVWEIAAHYTDAFKADIRKLNIDEPDIWCKATAHLKEQIAMVKALIAKGVTYETSDGIYFDTSKIDDYGKLARLKPDALEGGKRVGLGEKRHKTDFALWKFSPTDTQRAMEWLFDGPRAGMLVTPELKARLSDEERRTLGFPGWHIECSAMSSAYLGEQFDLHTGGIDHIPVHHTNEIAQAETAFGKKPWVKYWMHAEFLVLEKEKMAKSGEHFLTLAVLEGKGYDPLDYRYFCLTAHYRQQLMFSWDALEGAKQSRQRLKNIIEELREDAQNAEATALARHPHERSGVSRHARNHAKQSAAVAEASTLSERAEAHRTAFLDAMNDDLNAPRALATLWDVLRDKGLGSAEKLALVEKIDTVLSLDLLAAEEVAVPDEVRALAEEREAARRAKEWARADELRDEIRKRGYTIADTKEGWKIKKV